MSAKLPVRLLRALAGALLAIAIPALLMGIATGIGEGDIAEVVKAIPFFLFGAYIFGAFALISALIMEFLVNPRVAEDWKAYAAGGVLGMLSASIPFLGAADFAPGLTFAIGLPVGLLMGWMMRRWYRR